MQEKFGRQYPRLCTPKGVKNAQLISQDELRCLDGKLRSLLIRADYKPRIYDDQAVAFYRKKWFFMPETPLRQEPVMLEFLKAKCYADTTEPDLAGLKVILRGTGKIQTRIRELLMVKEPMPTSTSVQVYVYAADILDAELTN